MTALPSFRPGSRRTAGRSTVFGVTGPPTRHNSSRCTAPWARAQEWAAWLCRALGLGLVLLDSQALRGAGAETAELLALAVREALLTGAGLALAADPSVPVDPLVTAFVAEAAGEVALTIVLSDEPINLAAPCLRVELRRPSAADRLDLWQAALNSHPLGQDQGLPGLALRYGLGPAAIAAVARQTREGACDNVEGLRRLCSAGAPAPPPGVREREPVRTWDDLILPDDPRAARRTLRQARTRGTVLDDWGFGARLSGGKGTHALFSGPPGTGKTLAAEVVARALDRRLWRVDLAQLVSKYIGETEKNLDRVFRAAEAEDVLLFFDEADALFGRRGEVKDSHDRYANQEVCYLLQRMEDYPGVAVLATNLARNLDEAFLRRLQFVVDFPFPDEEHRKRIWEVMFPTAAPLSPAVDLAALARAVRLSGGHIRNIALAAAYSAAERGEEIGMAHLWHATRREYQKVGQAWSPPSQPQGRERGHHVRSHTQTPASQQGSRAPATEARAVSPASGGVMHVLRMQRSHGNRFVQRTLSTVLQPKLTVNRAGDRYEEEADRIAGSALQSKCACGNGVAPCERCAGLAQRKESVGAPGASRPFSSNSLAPAEAPPSVEKALSLPGRPLPEKTRVDMESRLGGDFGGVIVHDGSEAQQSAMDVSAKAFTVGRHVVFGRGQFQTDTTAGRRLLAHELVHVMQQTGHEQAGRPSASLVSSAASGSVQRAPLDSWGWVGDTALDAGLTLSMIPSPLRGPAAASVRGFAAEVGHQFSGNSEAISSHLKELKSLDNLKSLFGGYYGGLLAGIISPLTGLFDMLVFADRLRVLVDRIAADAANRFAALVEDARQLASAMAGAASAIKAELLKLKANPIDLLIALVTDQGPSKLEAIANKAGHDAVIEMASAVAKRFSPHKEGPAKRTAEEAPLAQAEAKLEEFKESLFSTPWSKVGYDIGYAVGFAAVNVLMLVFSGGIGNALTKLGSVLGELGGVLAQAGKLVSVVGRAITFVEEAINAVMNVAMKPLQPLLRALEPHLQKLVVFLRKLLGLAEKESAEAVAAAAKTTAAVTRPKPAALHPAAPQPHAPAVSPPPSAPSPHTAGPHPVTEPHVEAPGRKAPPPVREPHLDPNEAKALERTRYLEHLDQRMIDDELKAASKLKSHPSTEPGYVEERVLPNGHTWRKNADGTWCRFSAKPPSVCVSDLEAFLAKGGTVKKIPAQPTPEPEYTAVPRQSHGLPSVERPGEAGPPAHRGPGSLQMSKDFAHDLGVEVGKHHAELDNLVWHFDNPRNISRTTPGFDSIFKDAEGNLWVVEFKGGTSRLKPTQMSNEWINRELKLLEANKDTAGLPIVKELREALNSGRLKGRSYLTQIDPAVGTPLPTEVINHHTYSPLP